MIKLKNKMLYLWGSVILFLLLILILTYFIVKGNKVGINTYKNDYYTFRYDSTWKLSNKKDTTYLTHKSSKGEISITYKKLDTYLIDVDLKDIISDITYEIEKQNKGYKLINRSNNENGSYELLYEKDNEESLVYIYKQDNIILFIYYNTSNTYFDITMESYEIVKNSIKVYSGEKM